MSTTPVALMPGLLLRPKRLSYPIGTSSLPVTTQVTILVVTGRLGTSMAVTSLPTKKPFAVTSRILLQAAGHSSTSAKLNPCPRQTQHLGTPISTTQTAKLPISTSGLKSSSLFRVPTFICRWTNGVWAPMATSRSISTTSPTEFLAQTSPSLTPSSMATVTTATAKASPYSSTTTSTPSGVTASLQSHMARHPVVHSSS